MGGRAVFGGFESAEKPKKKKKGVKWCANVLAMLAIQSAADRTGQALRELVARGLPGVEVGPQWPLHTPPQRPPHHASKEHFQCELRLTSGPCHFNA